MNTEGRRDGVCFRSGRKLPAYGRALVALRDQGLVPRRGFFLAHIIVVLDTWNLARGHKYRLVVDANDEPSALDFAAVAGLEVILAYDSNRSPRERVAAALEAILCGQPYELIAMDVRCSHAPKIIRAPKLGIERATFP